MNLFKTIIDKATKNEVSPARRDIGNREILTSDNTLDFNKRRAISVNLIASFIIIAYIFKALIDLPVVMDGNTLGVNSFNPYYIESLPFYLFITTSIIVLVLNYFNQKQYSYSIAIVGWSFAILALDIVSATLQASSILFIPLIFGAAQISKSYVTQIFSFLGIFSLLIISLFNIGYPTTFLYTKMPSDFITLTITSFILLYIIHLFVCKTSIAFEELLSIKNMELFKQTELLEEQKEKITQLENQRKSFFINTAHELRTPLTLILGPLTRLTKEPNLEPKLVESLQGILTNSNQIKDLVNQLLDSVKTEDAVLQINKEVIELNSLLSNILKGFKPIASYRSINFQKDIQIKTPHYIQTDIDRLKIIIKNVLINAFKFTEKDGTILFKAWEDERFISFEVKDTGVGIEASSLPHIFEIFYQAPKENKNIVPGSGLGLYIVNEYLKILGGTIKVKSDVGFGTTFTMKIPYNKVTTPQVMEEVNFDKPIPADEVIIPLEDKIISSDVRQNILIVEDSLELNDYIKSIFSEKYHIHQAYDGQEALSYLEEKNQIIDLIISDVKMPNMNGIELLEKIRHSEKQSWIPIIMLTCKDEIADKIDALKIGADAYLTKPFEEEELLIRVSNLLKNSKQRKFINQNNSLLVAPTLSSTGEMVSQEELIWLDELKETCQTKINNVNLTIDHIAEEMNISRAQFFRRVKKLTGLNPGGYLQELRLQEALILIKVKKYSTVKSVAYSVGFKSDKYFSKKFKTRFGVYPSKYHDQMYQRTDEK